MTLFDQELGGAIERRSVHLADEEGDGLDILGTGPPKISSIRSLL